MEERDWRGLYFAMSSTSRTAIIAEEWMLTFTELRKIKFIFIDFSFK